MRIVCPELCIAQYKNAFLHGAHLRNIAFDAVDDDSTRHTVESLPIALAMRMRVVPVETGSLIKRDINTVLDGFSRHRHHGDCVILGRCRRDMKAMEVKISHVHTWSTGTLLGGVRGHVVAIVDAKSLTGGDMNDRRDLIALIAERTFARVRIVHCLKDETAFCDGKLWQGALRDKGPIQRRWSMRGTTGQEEAEHSSHTDEANKGLQPSLPTLTGFYPPCLRTMGYPQ